jgi:flagellar basal body-associated protein FliL
MNGLNSGGVMADEKKGSLTKLLIIVLVILVVDIVGGLVIGVKVIIPMLYNTEATGTESDKVKEEAKEDAPPAVTIKHSLEPINLNPRNSSGDIFSIDIVLEATDQLVVDELTTRDYEIRDKLSSYLAFKTVDELNNPENWELYKKEMMEIINKSLTAGMITGFYIPSKIIQYM